MAILFVAAPISTAATPIIGVESNHSPSSSEHLQFDDPSHFEKRGNQWTDYAKSTVYHPTAERTPSMFSEKMDKYRDLYQKALDAESVPGLAASRPNAGPSNPLWLQGPYIGRREQFLNKILKNEEKHRTLTEGDVEAMERQAERSRNEARDQYQQSSDAERQARKTKAMKKVWQSEAQGKEGRVRKGLFRKLNDAPKSHAEADYLHKAKISHDLLKEYPDDLANGFNSAKHFADKREREMWKATALANKDSNLAKKVAGEYGKERYSLKHEAENLRKESMHYNAKAKGWEKAIKDAKKNAQVKSNQVVDIASSQVSSPNRA